MLFVNLKRAHEEGVAAAYDDLRRWGALNYKWPLDIRWIGYKAGARLMEPENLLVFRRGKRRCIGIMDENGQILYVIPSPYENVHGVRFSFVHEIGHKVFGHSVYANVGISPYQEMQANAYASMHMVPSWEVDRRFGDTLGTFEDWVQFEVISNEIRKNAQSLKVSTETLFYRLTELGMITDVDPWKSPRNRNAWLRFTTKVHETRIMLGMG